MRKVIAFFARKSHNVKVQLLLATFYGLLSIFGVGGTIAIIMKVRKLAPKQKARNHAVNEKKG